MLLLYISYNHNFGLTLPRLLVHKNKTMYAKRYDIQTCTIIVYILN